MGSGHTLFQHLLKRICHKQLAIDNYRPSMTQSHANRLTTVRCPPAATVQRQCSSKYTFCGATCCDRFQSLVCVNALTTKLGDWPNKARIPTSTASSGRAATNPRRGQRFASATIASSLLNIEEPSMRPRLSSSAS